MANIQNPIYVVATAFLILAPTTACAHKDFALDCHIEGIKYLGTDLDNAAVCDRLVAGLGKAKSQVTAMHIVVTKRGAINVQVTRENGESLNLGMDIIDRPMHLSDLDELAKTIAGQLQ